jgi:hypothetical protein
LVEGSEDAPLELPTQAGRSWGRGDARFARYVAVSTAFVVGSSSAGMTSMRGVRVASAEGHQAASVDGDTPIRLARIGTHEGR